MAMGGSIYPKPLNIHLVTSTESAEFTHLVRTLSLTSIIGLDAEWKPFCSRSGAERYTVPTVSLLQVACQLDPRHSSRSEDSVVFLLDLCSIHLPAIWPMLRDVFVSRDVLKLGFQFKQDLVNLSHTFVSQGCEPGFDRVEPYMDISSMYTYLQSSQLDSIPKATKGLAAICNEVLGISLSKELQCSDWSSHPLTEDQKIYAAADVDCLLEIFSSFEPRLRKKFKGLAKHLRYLGIDAALPSKKRVIKELFNQSYKEKRVLLTDDVSLLGSTIVYLLKTTGKDEQLLEVFNTFQLKITKGQLASRCCDCNGTWIKFVTGEQVVGRRQYSDENSWQELGILEMHGLHLQPTSLGLGGSGAPTCFHCSGKSTRPLRAEEAVEVAKDMERTLGKNVVFWQCLGCSQLHWEGNYCMLLLKLIDAGKFYDLT